MKFSIVHKISLTTVLLVLVTAGVVGGLFYTKTTDVLVEQSLVGMAQEIQNAGDRLTSHIGVQNEDVRYVIDTPPIQGILRAKQNNDFDIEGNSSLAQWMSRLQLIFHSMLKNKPAYLKIRFIDNAGQEMVVVGREGAQFVTLNGDELQSKAHRTYVIETLKLSAGEVFLSEINLNREYGEVSLPYTEVLRSASPVFDKESGEIAGLVLITAEIGNQLTKIQDDIKQAGRNVYITNDTGGYLLHPDFSKSYGFDLGEQHAIQKDIPSLSKLFLPENKDTRLILLPKDTNAEDVLNFTKISFDPRRPERFITVGIIEPYSDIVALQTGVMGEVVRLALTLAVIVTVLAVLFAYRLTLPLKQITKVMDDYTNNRANAIVMPTKQKDEIGVLARSYQAMLEQVEAAQAELKTTNNNLESMVEERTADLEASEMFQRSIIENIIDGLITINEQGLITSFNPAAEKIFGYKPGEVIGNNVKMLMPEIYASKHDGYLNNYQKTGDKKIIGNSLELEGLRKDGSVFPMDIALSEMTLNGEKLFAGMVRDVTERKQMDKMKNEFISTVSHELRTPLTSIRGSLGLLSGGAVGKLSEHVRDMIKIASNNTERLLLLINDILDIQKIESGQMAFNFQNLEMMPFLERAIEENAAYGEEHGVSFNISSEVDDVQVYADKDRLMQVMANLLSNAAKFSPRGEVVELSIARHHNDTVRISVTDHGHGIPAEFQPKLFEKFTQSDSSDTRQKGGTGLGLSITKVIVEKHGGRIEFISRVGVGSTFYVELPILVGNKIKDEPRKLEDRHRASILIVEDDPDVAALLNRMLAEAGYNCDIAYDADEARKYLKERPDQYKAITLDLILPGEDGISFLESLRDDSTTYGIPIVVISVKANEAKRDLQGGAVGVVDWLKKPIDPKRLLDAVRQAVGPDSLPRILHVEDEPDVHKIVSMIIRDHCGLTWTTTVESSREALESEEFDLVLLDIGLPDGSGLELLDAIERQLVPPKVVIFSARDVTAEYADKVSAVLLKSNTTNVRLAEAINSAINSGLPATGLDAQD